MQLPTITMDRTEARKAFLEYRVAVRASLDREAETLDERRRDILARRRQTDEAMMRGYRLLSLGRVVIDLERAIREGGEDESFRPRLAVARADVERINLARWRDGSVSFRDERWGRYGPTPDTGSRRQRDFSLPAGTMPTTISDIVRASAIVPTIPPHLRPEGLERFTILWEAEWIASRAPRDPALLRSLGGGLYAVLATWDLTELEQTVLGIARRP